MSINHHDVVRAISVKLARNFKLGALLLGTLLTGTSIAAPPVTIATGKANFDYITEWFTEAKGCENIHSLVRPNIDRGRAEMVLVCKALKLGGYDGELKLMVAPNYTRALLLAADGEVTMPAQTLWTEDLDDKKFYATKPLLADGEIVMGVFVSADKVGSYTVKNLEDLKKLKAVTPRNWTKDWSTLTGLGIQPLDAATGEAIFRMIGAERAQFTLFGFNSSPNFEMKSESVTLIPIQGIKVYLHGERRFAVSKTAPNGLAVFNALNKGIEIMRSNGALARAWREAGVINKNTESWTALN